MQHPHELSACSSTACCVWRRRPRTGWLTGRHGADRTGAGSGAGTRRHRHPGHAPSAPHQHTPARRRDRRPRSRIGASARRRLPEGRAEDAPSRRCDAEIRQRDENFVPRVVAVPVGSTVDFPNDDPIYHNVFSLSRAKTFNLGRFPRGKSRGVRFDKPGVVKVFCEIHSHMTATVMVFNHPWFAMPDEQGRFDLSGVPPGTHQITAWHERLGDTTLPLRVERAGGDRRLRPSRARAREDAAAPGRAHADGDLHHGRGDPDRGLHRAHPRRARSRARRRNRQAGGQRTRLHRARGAAPAGPAGRDGDAGREPDAQGRARHLLHGAALQRLVRRAAACDGHRRSRQAGDANVRPRCSPSSTTDGRMFTSAGPAAGTLAVGQKVDAARGHAADIPERGRPAGWRVPRLRRAAALRRSRRSARSSRGTSLDANYAQELSNLSAAGIVITVNELGGGAHGAGDGRTRSGGRRVDTAARGRWAARSTRSRRCSRRERRASTR